MNSLVRKFVSDRAGASLIEFSLLAPLLVLLTGGVVDFSLAVYQWSAASKALHQGVRLAATSDPLDASLKSMTGLEDGANVGDPFPPFTKKCSGNAALLVNCSYVSTAMDTIIYGYDDKCEPASVPSGNKFAGMCDIFWRIGPDNQIRAQNVIVTYEQTGLGFAGRPGGPVPTITIELTGLTFDLPFLNGVFGLSQITMPPMRTSATGEDLSTLNNN